jgi:hypothetical protein
MPLLLTAGDEHMSSISEVKAWVAERAKKDTELYERYGRPLESGHTGEIVAISDDGQIILGPDELAVAASADERFGPVGFAVRKIGAEFESRIRALGS